MSKPMSHVAPPPPVASAPAAAYGVPDLSARDFRAVRELIHAAAGIALQNGKEGLVRARLGARLRALDLPSVRRYLEYVEHDRSGRELVHMIDVLTTNKTSFFREAEHFRFVETRLVPALASRTTPIRFWSAGCSSGEEAYTLAMVLRESLGADRLRDTRILATDISTRILDRARAAVYPESVVADVPAALAARHFTRESEPPSATAAAPGPRFRVTEATRALVTVARLNLMSEWPMRGPFDAIFCRNVMIYFDKPTQERLVQRFARLLAPGGYLFVGHSESLTSLDHGLSYRQPAVYQR
jgi:chemotaxis protein methyltransferase CheR